jgi:predicted DNA-binding transcriptional regulator AlpA
MAPENETYLTTAQVCARYNHSHMWIERRMADSGFPRPTYFRGSRLRHWPLSALIAWEEQSDTTASHVPQDISAAHKVRRSTEVRS